MMDDLIKKDLLAHKIYSSWQFIKYTEKNIDIVHYCADTINNLVDKMEMKTIRWQQDIVSDFVDDVTKDGKKVKRLSITKENSPMYELRVVGEKVDPWFLFDKLLKDKTATSGLCILYMQHEENTVFYHANPYFDVETILKSDDDDFKNRVSLPF